MHPTKLFYITATMLTLAHAESPPVEDEIRHFNHNNYQSAYIDGPVDRSDFLGDHGQPANITLEPFLDRSCKSAMKQPVLNLIYGEKQLVKSSLMSFKASRNLNHTEMFDFFGKQSEDSVFTNKYVNSIVELKGGEDECYDITDISQEGPVLVCYASSFLLRILLT